MSETAWEDIDLPVAPLVEPVDDVPGEPADGYDVAPPDADGVPRTGNPGVDSAVELLASLDGLPPPEHAEVFDEVHRRLQAALTDLDRE
jgi:hypothetical protein